MKSSNAEAALERTLAQEANHRFANQLMILTGTVGRQLAVLERGPKLVPVSQVQSLWQDIASKIIGIAELHRLLARCASASEIDLCELLNSVSHALVFSLGAQERVQIVHAFKDNRCVSSNVAQSLSLVVSEVIVNSIKYAHPTCVRGTITLSSQKRGADHLIEITDDGVGLPEGFDTDFSGGTGFRLIRALVKDLAASLEIDSTSLGLTFRILLPAEATHDLAPATNARAREHESAAASL